MGREGRQKRSADWAAHPGGVAWVDFTPDGRLVSCGRDKIAKVWDQNGKELGKTAPFGDIALRAALSNDRIIAGDWTGEIRVSALDGKLLGELTTNPPTLFDRIALAEKRLADAKNAVPGLQQQIAALEAKVAAEQAAPVVAAVIVNPAEELSKKLTQQTEEVAKLREERTAKKEGTPEWTAANEKVQAKKAEIADTQAKLTAAGNAPAPAAPKTSVAQTELVQARTQLAQATSQIASAQAELERWKLAQLFQGVHNAKRTLADKQAQFEALVQTAQSALAPVEKAQADLAAAEKTVAEAPALVKEKQTAFEAARAKAEAQARAVATAEAALAEKEKTFASLLEAAKKMEGTVEELSKRLEAQTAEVAKLREARALTGAGTPAYDEANNKVQAKKSEIAKTEGDLAAAKDGKGKSDTPEIKSALAEVAKMKDALEKERLAIKDVNSEAAVAEKAFTTVQKTVEQAAQQVADLKAKLPEITKAAQTAKVEAERAASLAEKELAASKVDTEKRRQSYEAVRANAVKSAAVSAPQAKS